MNDNFLECDKDLLLLYGSACVIHYQQTAGYHIAITRFGYFVRIEESRRIKTMIQRKRFSLSKKRQLNFVKVNLQ